MRHTDKDRLVKNKVINMQTKQRVSEHIQEKTSQLQELLKELRNV